MDGVRSRWHLNPFVPNNSFGILYGCVCVDDEAVGRRTSNWFFGDMVKRRKSMRRKEGNEQKKNESEIDHKRLIQIDALHFFSFLLSLSLVHITPIMYEAFVTTLDILKRMQESESDVFNVPGTKKSFLNFPPADRRCETFNGTLFILFSCRNRQRTTKMREMVCEEEKEKKRKKNWFSI